MGEKVWNVSEVNSAVRELLENSLMPFWIKGEVGTLNIHRSGHVYMTLKDSRCQIRGVFFGGRQQAETMKLRVGMEVEAFGNLTVYEVRGEYQFSVRVLRDVGVGELQRKFEELKAKLAAEGLFDQSRKKPIPVLPSKIGLVTSPGGAAVRDFLQIINRRFPNINIKLYPAAVQGKGAEKEVARGISFFNRCCPVDVIVVTRGGGSIEDLWAFNEESLAREIAASKIPVISAVGHEIDFTICDFVSDMRVPTPSAAAELVIGRREEFTEALKTLKKRMRSELQLMYERFSGRFQAAAGSYVFKEPAHMLREKQQTLDSLAEELTEILQEKLKDSQDKLKDTIKNYRFSASMWCGALKTKLNTMEGKLNSLNPLKVLGRGYSIITDPETGRAVRNPDLPPGKELHALLAEGELELTVKKGILK